MKKAFTLIEMIVVIAIIGILAGVLLGSYSGIIERVRATQCESNLKNLAMAAGNYAVSGHYPYAESAQYTETSGGGDDLGTSIHEFKGWLSWSSEGKTFPMRGNPSAIDRCIFADDEDRVTYAITNGALWRLIGQNRKCYTCPAHVEACRKNGVPHPAWSYQMNGYFGIEPQKGKADLTKYDYIEPGSLDRADRILLFAEIQGLAPDAATLGKTSAGSIPSPKFGGDDPELHGCLKYKSITGGGNGCIGFNHIRNHQLVGHVAFADGHTEAIVAPKNGDVVNLTDWLCQGYDIVFRDRNYERVNESATE